MLVLFVLLAAIHAWKYRKTFEVFSSTSSVSQDVLFIVDTQSLILSGKLDSDCTEFHFVTTGHSKFYSSYIESGCGTNSTYFWITMDVPVGTTYLFMYYGFDRFNSSNDIVEYTGDFVSLFYTEPCPSGWSEMTEYDGRYLRADVSYNATGGSESHVHTGTGETVDLFVDIMEAKEVTILDDHTFIALENHNHTYKSTSDLIYNTPPYISLSMCKSSSPRYPLAHVALYNSSSYVDLVTYSENVNFAERLVCQKCDNGATVGSTGGHLTHFHNVTVTTLPACDPPLPDCYNVIALGTNFIMSLEDHDHGTVTTLSTPTGSYPETFYLKFMEKDIDIESGSHEGLISFSSALPPKGWSEFAFPSGLFPRASTNDAQIMQIAVDGSDVHNHDYSVVFPDTNRVIYVGTTQTDIMCPLPEHTHQVLLTQLTDETTDPLFVDMPLIFREPSPNTQQIKDEWLCYGIGYNYTSIVCSGHGDCIEPNTCNCTFPFIGEQCQDFGCYGIIRTEFDSVCSGNGICSSHNNCTCFNGYYGNKCEQWNCSGYEHNDTRVCGGFGWCLTPENCTYHSCQYNCHSHGNCVGQDICECYTGYGFQETYCANWNCSDIPNDDPAVCTDRNGECVAPNKCNCSIGYYSRSTDGNCEFYDCNLIPWDLNTTCTSHGSCESPETCDCQYGYYDTYCTEWNCSGVHKDHNESCVGHGFCVASDTCECYTDFYGDECENWDCYGIPMYDSFTCYGRGDCIDPNECICSQDSCSPLTKCVYGYNCGEVVWNGYWDDEFIVWIPYTYYEVLNDTLLVNYDSVEGRAYYKCADILVDVTLLGTLDTEDTQCYFLIKEEISTALYLMLSEDHLLPYDAHNTGFSISLKILSNRSDIAVVDIDKSFWECYDIPEFDTSVCYENGICVDTDDCLCDQDECDSNMNICVFGDECSETISNGVWSDKFNIEIPYEYIEVLDNPLLLSHDVVDQVAYYDCEDLISDYVNVIFNATACYFNVIAGVSTSLHIDLGRNNNLPYDADENPIVFTMLPLSDRSTDVDIDITKLFWECWNIPMYDATACYGRGTCSDIDECSNCDQSSCDPAEICVYGRKCGTVIWDGVWDDKYEVRIPYKYYEILNDELMLNYDVVGQKAYFKCSDVFVSENVEELEDLLGGKISDEEVDNTACYFNIVEGKSVYFRVTLQGGHGFKGKVDEVLDMKIKLNVLSGVDEIAEVDIRRTWKAKVEIPVAVSVLGFVFSIGGIILVVVLVAVLLIIIAMVVKLKRNEGDVDEFQEGVASRYGDVEMKDKKGDEGEIKKKAIESEAAHDEVIV